MGCFGDLLVKRFGKRPPPEWNKAVLALSDIQLERGMRRILALGSPVPPSLPEFLKLCRVIGFNADLGDRMLSPQLSLDEDAAKFDAWDREANRKLFSYIAHAFQLDPCRWGPPKSAIQAECTKIIVRWKNAWAQDQRESPDYTDMTRSIQFHDCMVRGEAQITAYLKTQETPQ